MFKKIYEGKVDFYAPAEKKISKELEVFYNPLMEYNRTMSIEVLNASNKKGIQIADPLAGSGIRSLRFLKELNKGIIKKIFINDYDESSVNIIKKNLALNKIKKSKYELSKKDANLFLMESKGFDYIDIDPFGTPNPFLDMAVKRIGRDGILAVTATDTGALCGSFPEACIRKYWAKPLHTEEMHEVGLRILIRKVQLVGIQFEKALIPILSYDKDHYMRIFFTCEKGKKKCDEIASQHKMYKDAGPIWTGRLHDNKIRNNITLKDNFTTILKEELDMLGFYELPRIMKQEKINCQKKMQDIIKEIKNKGYDASRTHFSMQGIKSEIPDHDLLNILRS